MVVKTDLCNFTEYKIYPGHGQKFVGKDAKIVFFLSKKAEQLYHQKIKAVKLTWTQGWRRMNKKGKIETARTKKKGKTMKFQKAIVGMSLEDMKRKRAQKAEFRNAAKEQAVKEAKTRIAKKGSSKPAGQPKKDKVPMGKVNAPKGGAAKQKNFKK